MVPGVSLAGELGVLVTVGDTVGVNVSDGSGVSVGVSVLVLVGVAVPVRVGVNVGKRVGSAGTGVAVCWGDQDLVAVCAGDGVTVGAIRRLTDTKTNPRP